MKRINLKINGMHCKACEMLITEVLEDAGAKNVQVSHKTGLLNAEIDEKKLSESKAKDLIKKEGYTVE